jgi:hypothetical protein
MKAFANDANPEMNRWFNHLLSQALIAVVRAVICQGSSIQALKPC